MRVLDEFCEYLISVGDNNVWPSSLIEAAFRSILKRVDRNSSHKVRTDIDLRMESIAAECVTEWCLLESGFTGTMTDKLGRRRTYFDGKEVPGQEDAPTLDQGDPGGREQHQGKKSGQTMTGDSARTSEHKKTVSAPEPIIDPALNRPSLPEERQPLEPPKHPFQFPTGDKGQSVSLKELGQAAEVVATHFNLRNIMPAVGRGSIKQEMQDQNLCPLDREYGMSGLFMDVKMVNAGPQEHRIEPSNPVSKEAFAQLHKGKAATMVVVLDRGSGRAYAYWRPDLNATVLSEANAKDWNYAGALQFGKVSDKLVITPFTQAE